MEINQEVLNNAREIYANLEVEDGKLYRPANGTEGSIFTSRWCDNCHFDQTDKGCEILTLVYCGEFVKEWIYQDNKPLCTAFRDDGRDDDDDDDVNSRYVRGQATSAEIEDWELEAARGY